MPRSTPPAKELKWVSLHDFSAGIQHRVNMEGGQVSPFFQLGAATPDTFRCIALPGGGLGPLPLKAGSYTPTYPANPASCLNGRLPISGFHIAGPVIEFPVGGPEDAEFHIAYEWIIPGSPNVRHYQWQKHRMWEAVPTIDIIKSITGTESNPTVPNVRPTWFHNYRANVPTDPQTYPGIPVTIGAWYESDGSNEKFWSAYPDPSDPTHDSVFDIDTTTRAMEHVIAHQARSLGLQNKGYNHGLHGIWTQNEEIWFTKGVYLAIENTNAETLGADNPVGYAAIASNNGNELFMVKVNGGASVVRGDFTGIGQATMLRLPGLPSAGNYRHEPAYTPVGLVYLTKRGGVWLWQGSESAEHLSYNLETDFWDAGLDNADFVDYMGKCNYWREWILIPGMGGWIHDWKLQSWWRMEDPSLLTVFRWHEGAESPRIWASKSHVTSTSEPVAYYFDVTQPAHSFHWTGQPIPQSATRDVKVRELRLVAHGTGTVAVTLFSLTGASETHTFSVAQEAYPTVFRAYCNVQTQYLQVQIDSDGGSTAAPIVYEVGIGYDEVAEIPATTT
jgi:hypothetical protein